MKLIQKTFIYYLIYSSFIFTIGTVVFFFSIKGILFEGIDDTMHHEKLQLLENFKYEKDFSAFQESDYLQVVKLTAPQPTFERYSTVQIFDSINGVSIDYRQLHTVAVYDNHHYEIIIRQSLTDVKTLINSILPIEMILFIGLIIGILIINRLVAKKIWAPFYDILGKLSEYEASRLQVIPALPTGVFEFDELNKGVEKMTNKIYNDYVSQKEFHEYSSHELQTPLAIIRNKLELLIQSKNLTEDDLQIISSLFDAVRRLSSLNKNLLLLSKIDNNQFASTGEVKVDELVNHQINMLYEIMDEKGIRIETDIEHGVELNANYFLMETLLFNLFSNAINHNINEGFIKVILTSKELIVQNSGPVFEGDTRVLFDRFRKRPDSENSVGLGLSLVKKIVEVNQFNIEYSVDKQVHSVKLIFN
ncbi:MAG: HAMP domain-containing sensor histidine kinase [Cytophagaceae bacterium]